TAHGCRFEIRNAPNAGVALSARLTLGPDENQRSDLASVRPARRCCCSTAASSSSLPSSPAAKSRRSLLRKRRRLTSRRRAPAMREKAVARLRCGPFSRRTAAIDLRVQGLVGSTVRRSCSGTGSVLGVLARLLLQPHGFEGLGPVEVDLPL